MLDGICVGVLSEPPTALQPAEFLHLTHVYGGIEMSKFEQFCKQRTYLNNGTGLFLLGEILRTRAKVSLAVDEKQANTAIGISKVEAK